MEKCKKKFCAVVDNDKIIYTTGKLYFKRIHLEKVKCLFIFHVVVVVAVLEQKREKIDIVMCVRFFIMLNADEKKGHCHQDNATL